MKLVTEIFKTLAAFFENEATGKIYTVDTVEFEGSSGSCQNEAVLKGRSRPPPEALHQVKDWPDAGRKPE